MKQHAEMFLSRSLLMALLSACSSAGPNLRPAATASAVPGVANAAQATDNGVHVVAQASRWPGEARITEKVTPIRVSVKNNSDQSIKFQYSSFVIVTEDGKSFSAIPPLKTEGAVTDTNPEVAFAIQPSFRYTGFSVAPFYTTYYPTMGIYHGAFAYDAAYYDRYYSVWDTDWLPTPEMLSRALPEGVIDPGGEVDGFLYFEKVDGHEERAEFRATFRGRDANNQVATVEIPFRVVESD